MTDEQKLALFDHYENYRAYVATVCQLLTETAHTLFVTGNNQFDEDGNLLTKVTSQHIVNSLISQEQKDTFLFSVLQKIEQFEQTTDTLALVTDITLTDNIDDTTTTSVTGG